MLLLPSTGRSQTVEELQQQILQMQQQISQLQGDKATYQQEIAGLEERKAAFEAQMPAIDALIQNAEGVYGMALAQALALINAQQAEREELELAQLGAMNYTDWLQEALDYLDQGSPTYTDDLNFITGELLGTQAVLSNVANRLNELDTAVGNAEALAGQAGQAYYGAQDLKDGVQQQIDALQAIIDSDNQSIQDIDSQIESLQNQINELNNM